MNDKEQSTITQTIICQVDNRSGYRVCNLGSKWVFLATALRWSVVGNIPGHGSAEAAERYVTQNNAALDSFGALFADHIESGRIPICHTQTNLLLSSTEKSFVVDKLKGMDGGTVGGLVENWNYCIGRDELFQVVTGASLPVNDDQRRGDIWSTWMSIALQDLANEQDKQKETPIERQKRIKEYVDDAYANGKTKAMAYRELAKTEACGTDNIKRIYKAANRK